MRSSLSPEGVVPGGVFLELPDLGELTVADTDHKHEVLVEHPADALGVLVEQRDAVLEAADHVAQVELDRVGRASQELSAVSEDFIPAPLHARESSVAGHVPYGVVHKHRNRRLQVAGNECLVCPAKQPDVLFDAHSCLLLTVPMRCSRTRASSPVAEGTTARHVSGRQGPHSPTLPYGRVRTLPYGTVWLVRNPAGGTAQDRRPTRRRLSRDDWARAALAVIGEGGIAAVAVEPLAAKLDATKGSFYWHFPNRDALIDAAVRLWEQERTDAVIEAVEAEPDAAARLRHLFARAFDPGPHLEAEIALFADADHPTVKEALRRVSERRLAYMAALFKDLGLDASEARSRARLVGALYVGYWQLHKAVPGVVRRGRAEQKRQLQQVCEAFIRRRGDV